jgi:hypothetical protein
MKQKGMILKAGRNCLKKQQLKAGKNEAVGISMADNMPDIMGRQTMSLYVNAAEKQERKTKNIEKYCLL